MATQAEEVARQLENGNQDPAKMLIAVEAALMLQFPRTARATTVIRCHESRAYPRCDSGNA